MKLLLFSFFALFIISTFAEGELEIELNQFDQIVSSPPSEIPQDYWRSAVGRYFATFNSHKSCVMGLTYALERGVGRTWFGGFQNGQIQQLYLQYGRVNTESFNGPFQRKLSKCRQRNGAISASNDGEDKCCVRFNGTMSANELEDKPYCENLKSGGSECCIRCEVYRSYAATLGIPDTRRYSGFYYGSVLSGPYLLHDNRNCTRDSCVASRGCPTVEATAMKDLCRNHIGQTSNSSDSDIQSEERYGGVWYFYNGISTGSKESAARGLANYKQQCNSAQLVTLGSPSNQNPSTATAQQDSPTENTRRNTQNNSNVSSQQPYSNSGQGFGGSFFTSAAQALSEAGLSFQKIQAERDKVAQQFKELAGSNSQLLEANNNSDCPRKVQHPDGTRVCEAN